MATQRICSIPGCGKQHAARDLCDPHFRRWQKSGDNFDRSLVVQVERGPFCTIGGCGKPHVANGYCRNHYRSHSLHGDPLATEKRQSRKNPMVEFLEGVSAATADECITWPYAFDRHGYGQFSLKRKCYRAHRFVCELVHGSPSATDLQAAHSCGVRSCVNPRHLRWATPAENSADMIIHGTAMRGSKVKRARLNEADIPLIWARIIAGDATSKIAADYNVSAGAISSIRGGKAWAWLVSQLEPVKPAQPAPNATQAMA